MGNRTAKEISCGKPPAVKRSRQKKAESRHGETGGVPSHQAVTRGQVVQFLQGSKPLVERAKESMNALLLGFIGAHSCHPRACLPSAKAEGPEDPARRILPDWSKGPTLTNPPCMDFLPPLLAQSRHPSVGAR
jgi:hypothetical protein